MRLNTSKTIKQMRFTSTALIKCGRLFCNMNLALPGHAGSSGWVMPHAAGGWGKRPFSLRSRTMTISTISTISSTLHQPVGLCLAQRPCFSHRKPTSVLSSLVPGDQGECYLVPKACKYKDEGQHPLAVSGFVVVIQTIDITLLDYFCLDYHQN